MHTVRHYFLVLFLCAGIGGCGSKGSADSDPPPGVRKNEQRSSGVGTPKKGKPFLTDPEKAVR